MSLTRLFSQSRLFDCLQMEGAKLFPGWRGLVKESFEPGIKLRLRDFFDLRFYDTQGGAKFLSHKVWRRLGTNFLCRDFIWDVELLWRLKYKKLRIKEVYIPCFNIKRGHRYLWEIWPMLYSLMKLWFYRHRIKKDIDRL